MKILLYKQFVCRIGFTNINSRNITFSSSVVNLIHNFFSRPIPFCRSYGCNIEINANKRGIVRRRSVWRFIIIIWTALHREVVLNLLRPDVPLHVTKMACRVSNNDDNRKLSCKLGNICFRGEGTHQRNWTKIRLVGLTSRYVLKGTRPSNICFQSRVHLWMTRAEFVPSHLGQLLGNYFQKCCVMCTSLPGRITQIVMHQSGSNVAQQILCTNVYLSQKCTRGLTSFSKFMWHSVGNSCSV